MQAEIVPEYLEFSVSVVVADGSAIVSVAGDLDCFTSSRLRTALLDLEAEGTRQVTLDIGKTQFVDSTGLSVLLGALKRLRDCGGSLVVRSPSAGALRLFDITGLRRVFDIR